MKKVDATSVQLLRKQTGAGILDCKKVLLETGGDMEAAADRLKALGYVLAAKKSHRVAVQGCVCVESDEHRQSAVMVEINCETDFMAKDPEFREFCDTVIQAVVAREAFQDIDVLRQAFESERTALITRTGEHLHIRRVASVSGDRVATYLHGGGRIGVILAATGGDREGLKTVAMQIAAMNPLVLSVDDLTEEVLKVAGYRLDVEEGDQRRLALLSQSLITNPAQTVKHFLVQNAIQIQSYCRFELGEGLDKPVSDFAAEVEAAASHAGHS